MASNNLPVPLYQTFAPAAASQQDNRQHGVSKYREESLLIERYRRLCYRSKVLAGALFIVVVASVIFLHNRMLVINAREDAVRRAEQRIGLDLERMHEANLYWDQPSAQGGACSAWKTRTYSAKLHNIPHGVAGINWCQKTPIDIPGFKFAQPEHCEKMHNGDVVGHWTLRDDKDCRTYWGRYNDLGCQGGLPGNRLVEMQLLDHHPPWNTGKQLCATTPWGDDGELPLICEDRGRWGFWGRWIVPDDACGGESRHVSEEVLEVAD